MRGRRTALKTKDSPSRAGPSIVPQTPILGTPGDVFEREADRAADQVMAGGNAVIRTSVPSAPPPLQASAQTTQQGVTSSALSRAARITQTGGQPLSSRDRAFFEPRFGRDLAAVRIHTDAGAARSINARAYTLRNHIAFAPGEYDSASTEGRRLMAHELTHTMQQSGTVEPHLQRACTSSTICGAPSIPGSPEDFGASEEAREARARTRRKRMSPVRARSSGHGGRARQLETVFGAHSAPQLALLHGIFLDADLSSGTAAMVWGCDQWLTESLPAGDSDPHGFASATKPCMFVPGALNRQAGLFNRGQASVGGTPRADWQRETLLTLVHEAEHVRFDENVEPSLPLPGAVSSASCTKAAVDDPLSEIVAIISEYKILFDAAAGEMDPAGPLHTRLTTYFDDAVNLGGENFSGALTAMGCVCDCIEVDALLIQAVDATISGWTGAEKTRFRTEIQARMPTGTRPSWPAAPSP